MVSAVDRVLLMALAFPRRVLTGIWFCATPDGSCNPRIISRWLTGGYLRGFIIDDQNRRNTNTSDLVFVRPE
jgi:hypothetical protein